MSEKATYTEEQVNEFIAQISTLEAANAALNEQLNQAGQMIAELNQALKEAENKPSTGSALPKVEVGGEKYQIEYPKVAIPTEDGLVTVTAEELAANKKLLKQLIEIGSGALTKI